jgi:hypothetical protein
MRSYTNESQIMWSKVEWWKRVKRESSQTTQKKFKIEEVRQETSEYSSRIEMVEEVKHDEPPESKKLEIKSAN